MRYRYKGFTFAEGECVLQSVSRQSIYTATGHRFLIAETHNCFGEIIPPKGIATVAAAQNWIKQRILQIEAGMDTEGGDAGLLNNNGSQSANYLFQNSSTSGIRITQPLSFGYKDSADGVTGRSFSFAITSEYAPTDAVLIYDFQETITWDGDCGPEYVGVELDTGEPDIQLVRQRTLQRIVQQGTKVGIGFYPQAPEPLHSNLTRAARPSVSHGSPKFRGDRPTLYPVSWRYVMMSPVNMFR